MKQFIATEKNKIHNKTKQEYLTKHEKKSVTSSSGAFCGYFGKKLTQINQNHFKLTDI